MDDPEQSQLFLERLADNKPVVKELPKLDLETIAANYAGPVRILRLECIANTSPILSREAFRLAILQAREGMNVPLYLQLVGQFAKLDPTHELATVDTAWVEERRKKIKSEGDTLEAELKAYKNNLIKESIRMANEDLGNFYLSTGSLTEAYQSFHRMREFCTTSKHIAEMAMKMIYVAILQRNWSAVNTHRAKILGLPLKDDERAKYEPVLQACLGLSKMARGEYHLASEAFRQVGQAYTVAEPLGGITFQTHVLTPNDVAIYGTLCALWRFSRDSLRRSMLENPKFRPLLELEPQLRRAMTQITMCKYSAGLAIIDSYMPDFMLDMYLQPHAKDIYDGMRQACITEWTAAFSVVTLDELASVFPPRDRTLVEEIEAMIEDDALNLMRIDLVDRTLVWGHGGHNSTMGSARRCRHISLQRSIGEAKKAEHELRLRLLRLNMQAADLVLKGSPNPIRKQN